ncbi:MAG: 16S rRNA processing protein RimM [Dehalococcoidia bacterium]|nr:16S rRNA processing protein RimM [Dehalococcoidia bacterium]
MADRIAVGRINSPWGLKGHVKVTPLTGNPQRLAQGASVLVRGERRRILEHTEPYGYPMLLLEGYTNRNAAEGLRGELLEIEESELPPLPEGEYYIDDLVGLTVVTVAGDEVGELVEVLTTGANDVYVVRRPGARDALIPAVKDIVQSVDLEARRVTVDPLPGLLD